MKYIKGLLVLLTLQLHAQVGEAVNQTCKPLDQVLAYQQNLARPADRMDVWDWDVTSYELDLEIDIEAEIIYGRTLISFTPTGNDLELVQLDFSSNMTVDSLYLNGASYNHYSDILSVVLDGSYNPGEEVTVGIDYHGHPIETGFKGFDFRTQYNLAGRPPMVSSLSEPYGARTWWPCKDVPTDKADSVKVSITVESELTAVSNGLLTQEIDNLDGTKTFVWEHKYPITTYLVFVAITVYEYWNDMHYFADGDSMPLEYWLYPSSATPENIARFNLTNNMLGIFNAAYGKYPFSEEKYGMAQFEWGGAMEHQTCASMGATGENTIAHELSHQWWGDMVTCSNFHHIWINEGFATYSEALYWGAKNGEAAYHAHMGSKDLDYNGSIYRADTSSVSWIFNYIVYGKGAWTLHMLRHVVGDSLFFEILDNYGEQYQYHHASTEDFQQVAEEVWGQDLEWFFDQWIYGSGRPVYEWWWGDPEPTGEDEVTVNVGITQTQGSNYPVFKMPIDLRFTGPGFDTTVVVWDSLVYQQFEIVLNGIPTSMAFDEQSWILKYDSQVSGLDDDGEKPYGYQLISSYPNPFNQQLTVEFSTAEAFHGVFLVHDLRGRQVYSVPIQAGPMTTQSISWEGIDQQGQPLSSGVYLVQVRSESTVLSTSKVSLLK